MTPDEQRAEWCYRYDERLGSLAEGRPATTAQKDIAEAEADNTINAILSGGVEGHAVKTPAGSGGDSQESAAGIRRTCERSPGSEYQASPAQSSFDLGLAPAPRPPQSQRPALYRGGSAVAERFAKLREAIA